MRSLSSRHEKDESVFEIGKAECVAILWLVSLSFGGETFLCEVNLEHSEGANRANVYLE